MASAEADERFMLERSAWYRGRAKINLRHLKHEDSKVHGVRTVDQSNVLRLVEIFRSEGCFRLEPEHYVPALISEETLEQVLQECGKRQQDLMGDGEPCHLLIPDGVSLIVLHGQHRLLAAEEFLWDKWWVVELYSDSMSRKAVARIREAHANARQFCDGDIYRNLRYHNIQGNLDVVGKWEARLGPSKRKVLKQMQTKLPYLNQGFDRLLPFIGLWLGFKIGCLSHLLPTRCPEQLLHYLNHMFQDWKRIFGHRSGNYSLLDPGTVKKLETLMPKYSHHDAAKIRQWMEDGEIFPAVQEAALRNEILANLLQINGRITSFHTFQQDGKYFEAMSKIMRGLLPVKFTRSVQEEFFECFSAVTQNQGQAKVQVAEDEIRTYPFVGHVRWLGFQQVFLATMRYFPVLTNLSPLRDSRQQEPVTEGSPSEYWYRIARLALDVGFDNEKIQEIIGHDWEEHMAHDMLVEVRPPQLYDINQARFDRIKTRLAQDIGPMAELRLRGQNPRFAAPLPVEPKVLGCNRPSNNAYYKDRQYLFADIFQHDIVPDVYVTSLAIQRDIFSCYLGNIDLPRAELGMGNNSPPNEQENNDEVREQIREEEQGHNQEVERPTDEAEQNNAHGPDLIVDSIDAAAANHLFEGAPDAIGFDATEAEMNRFHHLPHRTKPSDAVTLFLDSLTLVLYVWNTREYMKFSDNPEQQSIFEQVICSLADQGYCFAVIQEERVVIKQVQDLWAAVGRARLVLAGPKLDPHSRTGVNLRNCSKEDILSQIDEQQGQ